MEADEEENTDIIQIGPFLKKTKQDKEQKRKDKNDRIEYQIEQNVREL